MGPTAVLAEIERLPRTQQEPTLAYRNHLPCAGDGSSKMGRHVVGTFVIVLVATSFGSNLLKPTHKITQDRGVGVLLN
jgi:hypothetical protein